MKTAGPGVQGPSPTASTTNSEWIWKIEVLFPFYNRHAYSLVERLCLNLG